MYGKCPEISNALLHNFSGQNFAFYAAVSYITLSNSKQCRSFITLLLQEQSDLGAIFAYAILSLTLV